MVKLSVLVTFCNQRQYIKRALDSILAQKTNFDFEVLIGLDGVYDGSEEIIREYTDKHDFIRLYKIMIIILFLIYIIINFIFFKLF